MISNNEIINRLKEGKQYLDRMPSYWSGNFAFFYSKIHDAYYHTNISNSNFNYVEFTVVTPEEIDEYLTILQRNNHYFRDFFFEDWSKVHINIQLLDDMISLAKK